MQRSEAQVRFELIDPALGEREWKRADIRVEETAKPIDIVNHHARRRPTGRTDYVLRHPLTPGTEPIPLAILEAKHEGLAPEHGLQQGKGYRVGALHHVPFVFSSNGHLFIEYDEETGVTSEPKPLGKFPTPDELVERYLNTRGLSRQTPELKLLQTSYKKGRDYFRYYQDSGQKRIQHYAFKCMSLVNGQALIPDFRGRAKSHIIATTKDLLTTGVNVPRVRNIVFFRRTLRSADQRWPLAACDSGRIPRRTRKAVARRRSHARRLSREVARSGPARTGDERVARAKSIARNCERSRADGGLRRVRYSGRARVRNQTDDSRGTGGAVRGRETGVAHPIAAAFGEGHPRHREAIRESRHRRARSERNLENHRRSKAYPATQTGRSAGRTHPQNQGKPVRRVRTL